MRFGIMAMQIEKLLPSGLSAEEAADHMGSFSHRSLVRSLVEVGFNTVELGGDLSLFLPQTYRPEAIAGLKEFKMERNLTYTLHLPLWSVEPSTPLEPVRRGSVQALAEIIHATQPLEPEVYVLHATGALAAEFYRMDLPELAKALILRQFQGKAIESLEWLLRETGTTPRMLAIETVEFPFDLTLEIAEALDLSLCLDTGHVLVGFSGPMSVEQVLEASLPRLAEVHLHDGPWQGPEQAIAYGKDHRPLGEGDLDVAGLLDRLEVEGFSGPLIFELQVEEALASLEVIRSLRPGLL